MSEWVQITMHEAGYLENGLVPYFSGVTSYLATADVVGYKKQPSEEVSYYSRPSRAQIYLAVGDVLQAKMRETNKSFVVDSNLEGWLASTGFARFKPERVGNLPLYVYYIVTSGFFLRERDRLCVGSTQQAISDRDLRDIYVRLPRSLHEQDKIARILQTIDRAIEKTEALIEKYQQIKAGLMHDLFTRGIGPDGQLRPPREKAPELYQETPIGWIPKEWQLARFDDVCDRQPQNGLYKPMTDYDDTGFPIVRIDGFYDGKLCALETFRRLRLNGAELGLYSLQAGDILINRVNSIDYLGKAAIVPELDEPTVFESNIMRCRVDRVRIAPEYVILWLCNPVAIGYYKRRAKPAVAQASINQDDIRSLTVPLPNHEEQLAIYERMSTIDRNIDWESQKLDKLSAQKSGLMHDLLTGKVPVQVDEPETDPEAVHA